MNAPGQNPSVALVDAEVRCMDEAGTTAEALAWRDGRLIAVGTREDVLEAAGPDATIRSASGATVLPGFVDAHHHVSISVLYGGVVRLTPPAVTDIASLQACLAEASRSLEPGRWLVAMDWDEMQLSERRAPTRQELDDAVGDQPLFALHYSCHRALANSRALELAGIDQDTSDPKGGQIVRAKDGRPNGLLIERGMSRVEALARPDLIRHDRNNYLERLAAHYRAMVAVGITRVADTAMPLDLLPLYRESAERGDVLIPTIVCPVSTTGYLEAPWDVFDGPVTGEQEGPVTIGPVKLVFDGAPACSMCLGWFQTLGVLARTVVLALRMGSLDPIRSSMSVQPRLGRKIRSGIAIYRREEANEIIRAATDRGFGVATHAIGNEAVDVAVSAYEATGAAIHGAGIARLEHAAFCSREMVSRIAGCGAAVVTQPAFLAMPAYNTVVSVPGLRFFPLRWLLDAGVKVAGSSDYPVFGFDPLQGIRSAIRRRTASGRLIDRDQCIGLDEALTMYTRTAAEVCGSLDRCGTLEVGKRADLVVMNERLTEESLAAATLRCTIVGGEVLYGELAGEHTSL